MFEEVEKERRVWRVKVGAKGRGKSPPIAS